MSRVSTGQTNTPFHVKERSFAVLLVYWMVVIDAETASVNFVSFLKIQSSLSHNDENLF